MGVAVDAASHWLCRGRVVLSCAPGVGITPV